LHAYNALASLLRWKAEQRLIGARALRMLLALVGLHHIPPIAPRTQSATEATLMTSVTGADAGAGETLVNLTALEICILDFSMLRNFDKRTQKFLFDCLLSAVCSVPAMTLRLNRDRLHTLGLVSQLLLALLDGSIPRELLSTVCDLVFVFCTDGEHIDDALGTLGAFLSGRVGTFPKSSSALVSPGRRSSAYSGKPPTGAMVCSKLLLMILRVVDWMVTQQEPARSKWLGFFLQRFDFRWILQFLSPENPMSVVLSALLLTGAMAVLFPLKFKRQCGYELLAASLPSYAANMRCSGKCTVVSQTGMAEILYLLLAMAVSKNTMNLPPAVEFHPFNLSLDFPLHQPITSLGALSAMVTLICQSYVNAQSSSIKDQDGSGSYEELGEITLTHMLQLSDGSSLNTMIVEQPGLELVQNLVHLFFASAMMEGRVIKPSKKGHRTVFSLNTPRSSPSLTAASSPSRVRARSDFFGDDAESVSPSTRGESGTSSGIFAFSMKQLKSKFSMENVFDDDLEVEQSADDAHQSSRGDSRSPSDLSDTSESASVTDDITGDVSSGAGGGTTSNHATALDDVAAVFSDAR
jgi:hypothetical protein